MFFTALGSCWNNWFWEGLVGLVWFFFPLCFVFNCLHFYFLIACELNSSYAWMYYFDYHSFILRLTSIRWLLVAEEREDLLSWAILFLVESKKKKNMFLSLSLFQTLLFPWKYIFHRKTIGKKKHFFFLWAPGGNVILVISVRLLEF